MSSAVIASMIWFERRFWLSALASEARKPVTTMVSPPGSAWRRRSLRRRPTPSRYAPRSIRGAGSAKRGRRVPFVGCASAGVAANSPAMMSAPPETVLKMREFALLATGPSPPVSRSAPAHRLFSGISSDTGVRRGISWKPVSGQEAGGGSLGCDAHVPVGRHRFPGIADFDAGLLLSRGAICRCADATMV